MPELYKGRVVAELHELDMKIRNLNNFFKKEDFNALDKKQQDTLRAQYHIMTSYSIILEIRISAFI